MNRLLALVILLILSSCKTYKQDILFQLDDDFTEDDLATATQMAESNYVLKPNDVLRLDVWRDGGEGLVDPTVGFGQQGNFQNQQQQRDIFQYVVQADGSAQFPIVGKFQVEGMTLFEAEVALAKEFQVLYKDSFVKLRISNRRVFVLGESAGAVVPLENENTSLIEVLSLSNGINFGSKAQNIKVIRGELVYQVDLSSITGLQNTNMNVEPGDIIYIEPWRRPFFEALKDVSPILGFTSSVIGVYFLVRSIDNQQP